jgi:YidC/Oxa1 family membrane protein insertase
MLYGIPFFTLTSGWYFPIGVIIYWVTNNFITLGQQYWVLHKYPPPQVATKAAAGRSAGNGAKPGESRVGGIFSAFSRSKEDASPSSGPARKATNAKANPKVDPKANGKGADPGTVDGRSLAPKPGAKPVNPKKGGTQRRRSG